MHTRRRIAIVTGSRAEFGLLEPLLRALTSRKSLQVRLLATGMHLLSKFGSTLDHIRSSGWRIDAVVPMQTGADDPAAEAAALARGIEGISAAIKRWRSDVVVVLGDRIEAFAGACAASIGRRVLAHVHGGDRAVGDIDDALRNAITRMAHVHLAASQDAADRLRSMGEEPRRIFRVGAPGLDDILPLARAQGRARPNRHRRAVIVFHPAGRSARREEAAMRSVLQAVAAHDLGGAIIYPNSDPGHEGIIRAIQSWGKPPGWQTLRSVPRSDYLRLVMSSELLVGNSSSGIIESATLGVNAVNVGSRQAGRLRCGAGVLDCGESEAQIRRAIGRALRLPRPRPGRSAYGDGRSGERIARVLERIALTPEFRRKQLTY